MKEKILDEHGVISYEVHVGCYNCGKSETVVIPKGTLVETYQEGRICTNCGCKMECR